MHSRLGFILVAIVLALGATSCTRKQATMDPPYKQQIAIDAPEGKATVTETEGGSVTKVETDEGTVTMTEEGVTSVDKGTEGTTTISYGSVPKEAVEKVGLPVYPAAKGVFHESSPTETNVTFSTSDDFEKVVAWYKESLAAAYQDTTFADTTLDAGSWKMTNFVSQGETKQVCINWTREGDETTINLLSKPL